MIDAVRWRLVNFCDNDADREKVNALLNEFFPAIYIDYVKGEYLYRKSFFRILSVEIVRMFNNKDASFKKRLIVRIGGKKLFSISKRIGFEQFAVAKKQK